MRCMHGMLPRFEVWPYLEQFAVDVGAEMQAELGGRPDLIIGDKLPSPLPVCVLFALATCAVVCAGAPRCFPVHAVEPSSAPACLLAPHCCPAAARHCMQVVYLCEAGLPFSHRSMEAQVDGSGHVRVAWYGPMVPCCAGNYSDGNMVATLLSHYMNVTNVHHCARAREDQVPRRRHLLVRGYCAGCMDAATVACLNNWLLHKMSPVEQRACPEVVHAVAVTADIAVPITDCDVSCLPVLHVCRVLASRSSEEAVCIAVMSKLPCRNDGS